MSTATPQPVRAKPLKAQDLMARAANNERPLLAAIVRKPSSLSKTLLDALAEWTNDDRSKVDVVQVDMDEAPAVMDALRVSGEPELILWADGRIIERTEGEMDTEQVASFVAHALAPR